MLFTFWCLRYSYLGLAYTFMVEIFRENAEITGCIVRKWCLVPEFPAAAGGVADAQMLYYRMSWQNSLSSVETCPFPENSLSFLLRHCTQPGECRQVVNVRVEQVLGKL